MTSPIVPAELRGDAWKWAFAPAAGEPHFVGMGGRRVRRTSLPITAFGKVKGDKFSREDVGEILMIDETEGADGEGGPDRITDRMAGSRLAVHRTIRGIFRLHDGRFAYVAGKFVDDGSSVGVTNSRVFVADSLMALVRQVPEFVQDRVMDGDNSSIKVCDDHVRDAVYVVGLDRRVRTVEWVESGDE